MNYKLFQQSVIEKHGGFYAEQVELFFTQAVEFALEGNFSEAAKLGNDALLISEFSNVGYRVLYLIGMLCEAYLDNNEPELANDLFNYGMEIIDNGDDTYDRDLNQFLDLKIRIVEELKEKKSIG